MARPPLHFLSNPGKYALGYPDLSAEDLFQTFQSGVRFVFEAGWLTG
jgi:hypothetical protein